MKLFQSNMQTGILVLLVILVGILCIALFFTNKEVRNIKEGVVKSRHDISALQTLLNDVGLTSSGERLGLEDLPDNIIDKEHSGPPTSQFPLNRLPPNVNMFPPNMFPPGFNPLDTLDKKETNNPNKKVSEDIKVPSPLPANTDSEPATLNLENQIKQETKNVKDVIPSEDVEEVKELESKKQLKQLPKTQTEKTKETKVENKKDESSEEESSEEDSSDDDDE